MGEKENIKYELTKGIWTISQRNILASNISIPRVKPTYKCNQCGGFLTQNYIEDLRITEYKLRFPARKKADKTRPKSFHLDNQSLQNMMKSQSKRSNSYMDIGLASQQNSLPITENIYEEVEEFQLGMDTLDVKIKVTNEIIKQSDSDFSSVKPVLSTLLKDGNDWKETSSRRKKYPDKYDEENGRKSSMCIFHYLLRKMLLNNINRIMFCQKR